MLIRPVSVRSVLITLAVAALLAASSPTVYADETVKTPGPWILGTAEATVGATFEVWFDRGMLRVPSGQPVTLGSPGPVTIWLRLPDQQCEAARANPRRTTTAQDGPLLYVCVVARETGKATLVAAAGA